jgi:hypothetical protein
MAAASTKLYYLQFLISLEMMTRSLSALDIVIIIVLIIVAAIVIYLLAPLIIAIIIFAAAYFIYRWYKARLS